MKNQRPPIEKRSADKDTCGTFFKVLSVIAAAGIVIAAICFMIFR
ncbi:hypothetical protein [Paenibacillus thalictri]|nr:hypothetical protein [Paenibacillus thalictri]